MRPEVSDLLREVAADAPPARYGVDDAVRAGRRRTRRHRAAWATAAATVTLAVVGLPQLAAPRSAPPQPAAPTATPTSTTIRAPKLTFSFRGYPAGRFRVADPGTWSVEAESATVRGTADATPTGFLTAFRPGRFRLGAGDRTTPTDPIGGRRAFLIEPRSSDEKIFQLAWEYADDGSIAVVSNVPDRMTTADLRRVAEGFSLGEESPVPVGFRVGYVPDSWKLVRTSALSAQFLPTREATARLGGVEVGAVSSLLISYQPTTDRTRKTSPGPRCPENQPNWCFLHTERGGPEISVSFSGPLTAADATRVLTSVQVGDFQGNDAFPAYTRMSGE